MTLTAPAVADRTSSSVGAARPWRDHGAEWRNGYSAGWQARNRGNRSRGVRWRPDTGFEMKCPDCPTDANWWPITPEFWYPRNLLRCRACLAELRRQEAKAAYWKDPEKERARVSAYQKANPETRRIKQRQRNAERPEIRQAAARRFWQRNGERVLAQRREQRMAKAA